MNRNRTLGKMQFACVVGLALSALALFAQAEIPEWCRALPRPEYKTLQRVPTSDPWFEVASRLSRVGLTEKQVQVVWLKLADADPNVSLPVAGADANVLITRLGTIVRKA